MIIYFDLECVYDTENNFKDNLEKLEDKYGDKIDFMPELNKILVISVGYIDGKGEYKIKGLQGDEKQQIEEFFELAKKYSLCGFNIKNFDLPFIIKRALCKGIKIPDSLKLEGKKPWEINNIIDLQEIYKYNVWGAIGNLDLTCQFLGITSPKEEGISGKDVQKLHDNQEDDKIIEYCNRDVKACIQLHQKFLELNFC